MKTSGFNKEKLIFGCAAALLLALLFGLLPRRPKAPVAAAPRSGTAWPAPLWVGEISIFPSVSPFIISGEYPLGPAGELVAVNRERKTPFAPPTAHRSGPPDPPDDDGSKSRQRTTTVTRDKNGVCPPTGTENQTKTHREAFTERFAAYGTLKRESDGESMAFLRRKGDGTNWAVRGGDVFGDGKHRIAGIAPQAVLVEGKDGGKYVLKTPSPRVDKKGNQQSEND